MSRLFMFSKAFYKENPEVGLINFSLVGKKEKKAELIQVGSEKWRIRTKLFHAIPR